MGAASSFVQYQTVTTPSQSSAEREIFTSRSGPISVANAAAWSNNTSQVEKVLRNTRYESRHFAVLESSISVAGACISAGGKAVAPVVFCWTQDDLVIPQKSYAEKLALAARLRPETTLSAKQIAERLHLGKPKVARTNLHKFMIRSQAASPLIQLDIQ